MSAPTTNREHRITAWLLALGTILLIAETLHAPLALGQVTGNLFVSSVPQGWDCGFHDDGSGIQSVYVIHDSPSGTQGCRFRLEMDPGVTMTYLSEVHYTQATGNTQEGLVACYGECVVDPILVATVYYMSFGTSVDCSAIHVVPHPDAETIDQVACHGYPAGVVAAHDLFVYSGVPDYCFCADTRTFPGTPGASTCAPLAVQESTWGRVKALYRN